MKYVAISLMCVVAACGGSTSEAESPNPQGTSSAPGAATADTAPQPPVASAPAASASAAPSAEDVEKQKAQAQLEQDYAELEKQHAAELARLTPEVRGQVKALTDARYSGIKSALKAALKGPQRRPGHADRDAQRHPVETLSFLGVQPNHKVLEHGPGEGWYTELLAPALAQSGKLFVSFINPNGPREERATFYGKRTQLLLDALPEAYSKVEPVTFDPKTPKLSLPDESLDVVLVFRGMHGMHNNGALDSWLSEFHRALKTRGVLGVEQHRAAPGSDPAVTSKQGYLPEAFVIETVEKAGFKLLAKSEVNANPKDTKDHPSGVWSLPPTLRGGDQDRAKFEAIGESDRMTLKFVKR
jgi:predicted methyltransferase